MLDPLIPASDLCLVKRQINHTDSAKAKDIDLACDGVDGWRLFELGARLEEELQVALDLIPLNPPTRFTRIIERRGKVLL